MQLTTVMTTEECLELLDGGTRGRVSLNFHAMPRIVPVRYEVDRGRVVAQLQGDRDFGVALEDAVVAFEGDGFDPRACRAWSVQVIGQVVATSGQDFVIVPAIVEGCWLDD